MGMKPFSAKVESAQKSYDQIIAPFDGDVRESQTANKNASGKADQEFFMAGPGSCKEFSGLRT